MGLPFLTVLAPSKRFYANQPRSPKTLLDCARQVALQIHRWLPGRRIVIVGDTAFAAIDFLGAVRTYVSVVTRLRLDANLCAPAPAKRPGRGRPPVKGKRLPTLTQVLHDADTVWQHHTVTLWYGRTNRAVEIATGTAVWYRGGSPPVPIRWLLVRDPLGELPPQAFLCTDLNAAPVDILQWFVSRWQLEVTFQEVRAHLGLETQRQWSDLAILRTTPALLGLFSLVTLWAHDLTRRRNAAGSRNRRLVPKATLHLQRCNCGRAPRNLAPSGFFHVPDQPGQHENSPTMVGPRCRRTRICRVIR
jgi:hypothetical protein